MAPIKLNLGYYNLKLKLIIQTGIYDKKPLRHKATLDITYSTECHKATPC